jgi:hypothetical protein
MGTIKKIGEKSYNQDANGDWYEVESPVQKEPENAKVINGVTYYKDDAGDWYEGEKISQKKNDGQPSKTGGQEPKTGGVSQAPSPSQSKLQEEKPKTKEQIAKEDLEYEFPFLTEKININKPGDIMTGQQRQQMAASKVKADKLEEYRTQELPKQAKAEKEKAKQASLKPELGEQFNPVDFATNDIATYSGGTSLNLDPKAPSADKFHQINQFFGNDASNVAPYFDNRVKAVDKQIAQIKQNPMLWKNLNQGKSDIQEIEKLKDYKLKLAAASNKLATDYTAWLYPDESLERQGEIKRKLAGDDSVNQEIAFKEKGIPLTDEQKFNNAKQGVDVQRTRLENDYRDVPPEQRDDTYYQRLAQVNNMDETLLNKFPDYKKSQVGMMIAQLASQDPNIDATSLVGFIPHDLDQKTIDYISEKYNQPKELFKGIQYGDIPHENLFSNVRKSALGLTTGFVTGATRFIGSALGVDSDRLTYVNNKISGIPDYLTGNDPYAQTSHPQSIVDINPASSTYLQNIPNPKAGKSNYNLTTVSNAMARGAAEFAAFITGLELTTLAVKGGAEMAGVALTAEATQSAALTTYMVIHNHENSWQRANEVLGEDASDFGKNMLATLGDYVDKLAFDVLPKDKLFLGNEAKVAMDKELSPLLKDLTIKNINKEVIQTKVQKVVQGLINTSKEVGHITAAMDAAAISKAIVNSVVGKDEPKKYMEEAWHEVKQNTVEIPLSMALPLGVMEVVKSRQHSSFFKENVYSAGLEPNKYIALIQQELGKGNITAEEANSRMEVVKVMHNIVQSTPDINPKTNQKFTHNQQVEYAYNRLKESGLRAKALAHAEDPAISSIYLADAQDLADVRKAMLESFSKPTKQAEAPKEKTIPQQKVEIEKQRQDELEKTPEDADKINAKYDAEIEKLSNQEKPIESVMSKEDLDKTQSIIDRVGNNESINEGEMKEAEDILYDTLDKNPDSAHLIEPLILKLQNHENITKTETVQTTERKPVEGTFAAKRKIEIKPALEQSEGSTARVTLADGTTHTGNLRIKDGNYVLEVEGQEPVVIGEKAITDRDLKVPEGESPVELDEDGNVKSATFETKDGHRVTITDPEKALDLGIQLSLETVGEIPDEAFDRVYEDVIKEDKIEVPIEKPKIVEKLKLEAEIPETGEEETPEQKEKKDRENTKSKLKNLSDEKFDEVKKKAGYNSRDIVDDEDIANDYHDALKVPEPERTEKQNKIIEAVNEALGTKKRGKVKKGAKGKAAKFVTEHIEEPTDENPEPPTEEKTGEEILKELENKGTKSSDEKSLNELAEKNKGNKLKTKIIEQARKAVKTLKSIFPNMDIHLHDNEQDFNDVMEKLKGKKSSAGNFSQILNSDGSYSGLRIDVNLNKANGRTIAHEVTHAVLSKAFGENKALFKSFRDRISKILSAETNERLSAFSDTEHYASQGDTHEEYIAELTGALADNAAKLKPSTLEKIATVINQVVSKLTGGKFIPFKDVKNTKDVVDFLNNVSTAIREGQDLSNITKDYAGELFEPQNLNATGKLEKELPSTGRKPKSKSALKEGVDMEDHDIIDKNTMVGKRYSVTMSDHTKVGEYNNPKTGVKLSNLMGGVFYTYIKGIRKAGIGWASVTAKAAREMTENAANQDATLVYRMSRATGSRGNHNFKEAAYAELVKPVTDGNVSEKDFLTELNNKLNDVRGGKQLKSGEYFLNEHGTDTGKKLTIGVFDKEGKRIEGKTKKIPKKEITSLEQLKSALDKESFNKRGAFWSTIMKDSWGKKSTGEWYKFLEEHSVASLEDIANHLAETEVDNAADHDIVAAIKLDAPEYVTNKKGVKKVKIYTTRENLVNEDEGIFFIDAPDHPSYPYVVKGKPIGIFNEFNHISDYFPNINTDPEFEQLKDNPYKAVETKGKDLVRTLKPEEVSISETGRVPKQKTQTNDKENIPGLPSKVGVGEEPVTTEPIKGGGAQEISSSRIFQKQGAEGEGEGVGQKVGEVTGMEDVKQQELNAEKVNKEAGIDIYVARQDINANGEKYTLSQIKENNNTNTFLIEDANGNEVGKAQLSSDGNYLDNIRIDEKYRRKGLASNLYDFIELRKNIKLEPSPNKQSKEAKLLWDKRNLKQSLFPQQEGVGVGEAKAEIISRSQMPMDKKVSDMKDILKEYVDEGKSLDEIKDILKDEFGDYYKDVEGIIEQAHQEMTTTGIKNAVTERERGERGLAEIEVEAKRSFGKVFDDAKQMIANGVANGLTLAAEIIKNPRPLKAEESAVLLIDRMRISNEYNKKNAELLEAQENGETSKADTIQSQMEALEEEMDLNDEAARKSGYEQGLGLAARRMLIAQDYSLVTQMNRLKAANGGKEVPKQYQEQLQSLITQLEEANNKLEEFEKKQAGTKKQSDLAKISKVSRTPEQIAKEKQNIKSKIISKWGQTLARMKSAIKGRSQIVSKSAMTPEKQAQLESVVKDVNDMVKLYAEGGETNLKKIIDNIHQDLVGEMPDLNKSDVEDIVLGKYDTEKVKTSLTPEKIQALANVREVKTQIDFLKEELKNKQRSGIEKGMDYLHGWHRFGILSGVPSSVKIGTAALTRGIVTRAENLVGQALSLIPGIRRVAKRAPREGGINRSAEAKAFSSWFDKMTKDDIRRVMKTGISELDYLYGAKQPKAPAVPKWMEFFGRMHSAIKLLPKRAEFFRSLEMRTEQAIKEGKNPNDAVVQQELGVAAYNDALRAVFMQENILSEGYQGIVRKYEKTQPALASALKFLLPIVKVPSNYVAEQSSYVPIVALVKAITVGIQGRKGMTPEQADYFMRALKKGSIGTAFIALGFFNPGNFGGYYTGKRKKDDLEAGDIELFGVKLPHFMLHTPLLEMLQVGATMRRAAESQLAKGEEPSETLGIYTGGIPAVLKGQLTQIPFFGTSERIMKTLDNQSGAVDKMKEYGSSIAQSIIEPQLMQNIADWTDMEDGKTVKRESKGLVEKLKEGAPGFRKTLKQDKSKFTDKEYEEFSNITEKGLNIPELNKRTTYKVKIDTEHPDGHMTEEEYDKFIPLQKEYVKDAYKKFYGSHKSDFDKLQKMVDAVPETPEEKAKMNALKDAIQNKIDAVHNEAIKAAKRKIGLHQK